MDRRTSTCVVPRRQTSFQPSITVAAGRVIRQFVLGKVCWVLVPSCLAFGAEEGIPALAHPAQRDLGLLVESVAGRQFLAGAWGWFAVIVVHLVFNTVLGGA